MSWIFFTLMAAFSQSWRNALQSQLSQHVAVSGVTLSRFIFAVPMAAVYLFVVGSAENHPLPDFSGNLLFYVAIAAALQIVATALMVVLFKQKSFAIGAGLAKSEALVAAILGSLFFGSQLNSIGWVGVLLGTLAIFILSGVFKRAEFSFKTVVIGIACGASFALTSLYVREASQTQQLNYLVSAAWVLFLVLCVQTAILSLFIWVREPQVFKQLMNHKRHTLLISLTSCIGSIGWFTAMSLEYVAYVKTLGQIEVLFTILVSLLWLKQPVRKNDLMGLILISVAAVLVIWG